MTVNVRLMSITFNQPGFMPQPPMYPGCGAPMMPGGPFPPPPPPQPQPGHSATVNLAIDGDHGSWQTSFVVAYTPPDLNGLHNAAIQAAQTYFDQIKAQIAQA